jgi:hypothetical protein
MPLQFEARKIALKQDRTGFVLTLSMHPDEIPNELLRDFVGSRYACVMVKLEDDEMPTLYNNRVQKAGMLCRDHLFQSFMSKRIGLELDEDQTATALCHVCGIDSRTVLNGNKLAQTKFDTLVEDFEKWSRDATPF